MVLSNQELVLLQAAFNAKDDSFEEISVKFYEKYGMSYMVWLQRYMQDYFRQQKEKKYVYMVTFTLDPKKKHNEARVEEFIHLQAKRSALHVTSAYVSKEYHQSGTPHWHMVLTTCKPIRSDAFKYYQNRFGNIDLNRNKYNNEADALSYITKDSDPIKLI